MDYFLTQAQWKETGYKHNKYMLQQYIIIQETSSTVKEATVSECKARDDINVLFDEVIKAVFFESEYLMTARGLMCCGKLNDNMDDNKHIDFASDGFPMVYCVSVFDEESYDVFNSLTRQVQAVRAGDLYCLQNKAAINAKHSYFISKPARAARVLIGYLPLKPTLVKMTLNMYSSSAYYSDMSIQQQEYNSCGTYRDKVGSIQASLQHSSKQRQIEKMKRAREAKGK